MPLREGNKCLSLEPHAGVCLFNGVMAAQQILVLFVQVRVLVEQQQRAVRPSVGLLFFTPPLSPRRSSHRVKTESSRNLHGRSIGFFGGEGVVFGVVGGIDVGDDVVDPLALIGEGGFEDMNDFIRFGVEEDLHDVGVGLRAVGFLEEFERFDDDQAPVCEVVRHDVKAETMVAVEAFSDGRVAAILEVVDEPVAVAAVFEGFPSGFADVLAAGDDMLGSKISFRNQSNIVSLTNWTVDKVVTSADFAADKQDGLNYQLLKLKKNDVTVTVGLSKYLQGVYTHKNQDAITDSDTVVKGISDIKTKFKAGDVVSVTGMFSYSTDNGGYQIYPFSAEDVKAGTADAAGTTYEGTTVGETLKAIATAVTTQKMNSLITANKEFTLTAGSANAVVTYFALLRFGERSPSTTTRLR